MFARLARSSRQLQQLSGLAARGFASEAGGQKGGSSFPLFLGLAGAGAGLYLAKEKGYLEGLLGAAPAPGSAAAKARAFKPDYDAVRKAIEDLLESNEDYDDGSYGPVLVRLAWHSSGTYDKNTGESGGHRGTGGSNGATMRFAPEANWGANAGLAVARDLLEPVKRKHPWISYSDLWTLGGAVAVEAMGGPHIPWRPGRSDKEENAIPLPDGRLPDAGKDAKHIRDVFYRHGGVAVLQMGFDDQEIVALSGAHTLGRCHVDRSGFDGPWTNAPTTFSNLYFVELVENKWHKRKWDGPLQYQDKSNTLMMLPTDMWLVWDKKFRKHTSEYAKDQDKFFADFAAAFSKLLQAACHSRHPPAVGQHAGRWRALAAPVTAAQAGTAAAGAASSTTDENAFDWKLGLALAGCAFESYNGVEGDSLRQVSPDGTVVAYVDKRFLQAKMAGLLELTVHGARGLVAADWGPWGKSDPYAIVSVGNSSGTTRVVNQSLDPVWEETFYLFVDARQPPAPLRLAPAVPPRRRPPRPLPSLAPRPTRDPGTQRLTVRVLDEDTGKKDDLLGVGLRGLADLADGAVRGLELPLRGAGDAGAVRLTARLLPFGELLAEEAAAATMGGPVVWAFWNPAAKAVCLAFRGTEQTQWKDVLTDISLAPAAWGAEGAEALSPSAPTPLELARQGVEGLAKLGRALQRKEQLADVLPELPELDPKAVLEAKLRAALQEKQSGGQQARHNGCEPAQGMGSGQAGQQGEAEPWTLYLTGHSLGGALSTLCAYECAQRAGRGRPRPRLAHYNYGSPRVGNAAFAREARLRACCFNAAVPNTWRVANRGDAVALVPRLLGYCHVELSGDGATIELHTSDGLAEGAEATDVALAVTLRLPELAEKLSEKLGSGGAGAAGADGGAATAAQPGQAADAACGAAAVEVATLASAESGRGGIESVEGVAQVLEQEVDALLRLVDGSAVLEHLEPVYLANIRAAVEQLSRERERGGG
eukprot:scaffold15.g4348.t1